MTLVADNVRDRPREPDSYFVNINHKSPHMYGEPILDPDYDKQPAMYLYKLVAGNKVAGIAVMKNSVINPRGRNILRRHNSKKR